MKKKLLALVLVLALAASALSLAACGSDFASIYKNPYEDKEYSAYLNDPLKVLESKEDVSVDANVLRNVSRNSNLAIFETEDESGNTVYKFYNFETKTVVLTLAESETVDYDDIYANATSVGSNLYDFIRVEKTTTPEEGDPTTEYLIYYADGTLALSSEEGFKFMADATVFADNGDYYRIDKNGKFAKAGTLAKNVVANLPVYMNCVKEHYYNVSEGTLSVYDYSFNLTNYYELPNFNNLDGDFYVLNDGNVLIQYSFAVSYFESDYTYFDGQNNQKVVTLIYNVKKGEAKEIETEVLFDDIYARGDAYGMLDYLYDDSVKNVAEVKFITNKQLDRTTKNVSLKNDGSIDKIIDEAFVAESGVNPHSSGKFVVQTKLGSTYLVDKKGNVVADITDSIYNEKYIFVNDKIYDFDFKELATIDEDKWEFTFGDMNNAFVFRCIDEKDENAEKKFGLFANGAFDVKTLADGENLADANERYYVIRKVADNATTYIYYNENGAKIFETTVILSYKGTTRDGKVLLSGSKWDETANKYVYTNVVLCPAAK